MVYSIRSYNQYLSPYACKYTQGIREFPSKSDNDLLRSSFTIDCDKIIHSLQYNRYTDKTQVFSFYKNNEISYVTYFD